METLKLIKAAGLYAAQFFQAYIIALLNRITPNQKIKITLGLILFVIFSTTFNANPNKNPAPNKKSQKIEFKFPPPPHPPIFVDTPR